MKNKLLLCSLSLAGMQAMSRLSAQSNCQAGFTSAVYNDSVVFTGTSTGGGSNTHYVWGFGDGSVGSGMNPSHTYLYAGSYQACLVMVDTVNPQSCQSFFCDAITIVNAPNPPCIAGFLYYPISYSVAEVQFYDISKNPVSWLWDFGDGSFDNVQNPYHHYNAGSGPYNVSLTVITSSNDTCTTTQPVYAMPYYPSCFAAFVLQQDSINSLLWNAHPFVFGMPPFGYLWDFGDGNTSTQPYPSHTYAAAGHYNICFTVTDSTGCSHSFCDSTYRLASYPGLMGGSLMKTVIVLPNPTTSGMEENILSVNSVFPNPANDRIEISFNRFIWGEIKIMDITSREVYSEKINANSVKINVSSIPAGYYTFSIASGTKMIHNKMIIAR